MPESIPTTVPTAPPPARTKMPLILKAGIYMAVLFILFVLVFGPIIYRAYEIINNP